jgi:hypothetical protein
MAELFDFEDADIGVVRRRRDNTANARKWYQQQLKLCS